MGNSQWKLHQIATKPVEILLYFFLEVLLNAVDLRHISILSHSTLCKVTIKAM